MSVFNQTPSLEWELIMEARVTQVIMHAVPQTTEKRISKSWDIFWSVKIIQ